MIPRWLKSRCPKLAHQRTAALETPYRFTAKEQDTETGLYYYGARYYDPSLSIWFGVDKMSHEYPNTSPYSYCLNNPIITIDPDGNRVIFVNGHWNKIAHFLGLSPGSGGKSYWNYFDRDFISSARNFLGAKSSESNIFIDGPSKIGFDQDGDDRWQLGYNYAKENYKALTEGLAEGESFKLVGHSEGSAYFAGLSEYLIEQGHKVESMLQLSPDEVNDFVNPISPTVIQVHATNDLVAPYSVGQNSDYVFELKNKSLRYAHGASVNSSILNNLQSYKQKLDNMPYKRLNTYQSLSKVIQDAIFTIFKIKSVDE